MASRRCLLALAVLALSFTLSQAQQPGNCPADDGKWRISTNGKSFKIVCNFKAGTNELSRGMRPTFAACIDVCALTTGCLGVDYTADSRVCVCLSAATKGTVASPGTHNAYLNDDPSKKPVDNKPVDNKPVDNKPVDQKPVDSRPGPGPTDPKIETTTNPSCPETDGKAFVTDDGTYYKIQCGFHATGSDVGKYSTSTFSECMKKCSETNGCISVQYIGKPVDGYILNECVLSSGEGPGTTTCAHWFAYTIDPPVTAEDVPFPYTLCETSCPLSDGMIYESVSGENFKMSCGKRHGTKILWSATMETFDDCMDSCGKILACHSVDYQARTKKCYYGNHHGAPGVPAPGFASATTMGCSGACKKSCSCPAGEKA